MKSIKNLFVFITLISIFVSCDNDNDTETDITEESTPGSLEIKFSNLVKDELLVLNTKSYTNQSNESYTVKELKYIISNLVLFKENGDKFVYPVADSYFLINEENADSKKIMLSDIDGGDYSKISFGIGVDQSQYPLNGVANFIPTAEENGMLWSWSAGYKFIKFEGSFAPEGGENKDFLLHVGSHGEVLDNYKVVELDLSEKVSISEDAVASIAITADISKIFDSVNTHSLQVKSDVQVDPENAPKIAANVQTMFSIK